MKPSLRYLLIIGAMFISACMIAGLLGYRVNVSQSLPMGLWQQTEVQGAAYVEFCLPPGQFAKMVRDRAYVPRGNCPEGNSPFLKPVAAHAGDQVLIASQGIAVNAKPLLQEPIAAHDTQGRALSAMPHGLYKVGTGTLWVLSTYHPSSLDSRYFGAIPESSVIAGMRPVFVINQKENYALIYR